MSISFWKVLRQRIWATYVPLSGIPLFCGSKYFMDRIWAPWLQAPFAYSHDFGLPRASTTGPQSAACQRLRPETDTRGLFPGLCRTALFPRYSQRSTPGYHSCRAWRERAITARLFQWRIDPKV